MLVSNHDERGRIFEREGGMVCVWCHEHAEVLNDWPGATRNISDDGKSNPPFKLSLFLENI